MHSHWKLNQSARNKVNTEMRKEKSDYYHPKIGWKIKNSLTGKGNNLKTTLINDDCLGFRPAPIESKAILVK